MTCACHGWIVYPRHKTPHSRHRILVVAVGAWSRHFSAGTYCFYPTTDTRRSSLARSSSSTCVHAHTHITPHLHLNMHSISHSHDDFRSMSEKYQSCTACSGSTRSAGDDVIVAQSHVPDSSTTGDVKFLTKGDNNHVDDRGLYAPVC